MTGNAPLSGAGDPRRPSRTGDLPKRIVSSLLIAPVAGLLIFVGGAAFDVGILVIAALMAWEWGGLISASADSGRVRLILLIVLLATFVTAEVMGMPMGLIVTAVAIPVSVLLARQMRVAGPIWLAVAVVGTVVPALALIWMRSHIEFGLETVMYVIASVIMTDIGAYAAGRTFGGPKLMPRVSPSKTWAGLIGGIAAAMLIAVAFATWHDGARLVALAPLAVAIAVIAQAGDLLESAVKRHFNVKDSGTLIPGHGGILDRVDGQMTVLPVLALAMAITERSVLQW